MGEEQSPQEQVPAAKPKKKWKKVLIIIGAIVLLTAWFFPKHHGFSFSAESSHRCLGYVKEAKKLPTPGPTESMGQPKPDYCFGLRIPK